MAPSQWEIFIPPASRNVAFGERELPHPRLCHHSQRQALFNGWSVLLHEHSNPLPWIGIIRKGHSSSRVPLGVGWGLCWNFDEHHSSSFPSAWYCFPCSPMGALPRASPIKFLQANIHWRLFPKKIDPSISLVTIYPHRKLLQNYWPYFLCCILCPIGLLIS